MEADEALQAISALADLVHEQTLAIAGDRPEAVALISREIERRLARLGELPEALAGQRLDAEPSLRLALDRLRYEGRCAQAEIRVAMRRLVLRRAFLARMGVQWYGARLSQPGQHNSFTLSA